MVRPETQRIGERLSERLVERLSVGDNQVAAGCAAVRAGLQALPDHLRIPGFFACWTRKEAFLKATGDGLSFPLVDFSVTAHPDLGPELEEINGSTQAGKQWFLADISVFKDYRATVAVEDCHSHLETYAWN